MRFLFEGFRFDSFFYPNLRVLDLTSASPIPLSPADNQIGEKGVWYLVSMIRNNNCPRLEELSLISMAYSSPPTQATTCAIMDC